MSRISINLRDAINKSKNIVDGHIKELKGENQELYEKRLAICKKCPLFKESGVGFVCNRQLWMNPETGEVSTENIVNWVRGCGCRLNAKLRIPSMKCPANKW